MKNLSKDGRTWFKKNEDGSTEIGLTASFLNDLDGCWHMMAAASTRTEVKEEQPLLSVETNDGLFSVTAPVAGVISFFAHEALNFPDKVKEDTVVAIMKPYKKEEEKKPAAIWDDPNFEQAVAQARVRLNLQQAAPVAAQPMFAQQAFFDEPVAQAVAQPIRRGDRR